MSNRFEERVALITGAGSGLGRDIAHRLAAEGATVVGVDRDAQGLTETASAITAAGGRTMTTIEADLSLPEACSTVVERAVAQHGRLDILGNIAGVALIEHFEKVTVEQYRRLMAINTDACFHLSQAALPHLVKTNGTLINIASSAGLVAQAYTVAYSMSKAAVVMLTKGLAMEYLKTGVRINAIAPGGIRTQMISAYSRPDDLDDDLFGRYLAIRGVGDPDDISNLFLFLASDEASNIHGAVISSDRGSTAG